MHRPHNVVRIHEAKAFSLIELSIVLAIIGLLVGGVLSGQALVRASELRAVATQHGQFLTATNSFRAKYSGLPGDIRNATKIWGAVAAPASCATTVSTGTATCDGDGDDRIAGNSQENFRFWQHLANAGMIGGSFSGTDGGYDGHATAANSPKGKLTGTLWAVDYRGIIDRGEFIMFRGEYGNVFYFGGSQ